MKGFIKMELIYKVIGNFDDCDFEEIIDKISAIFKFIYLNDTLYLSLVDYKDYNKQHNILCEAFQPQSNFVITPITEKNIMKQQDVVMQWCRDNFLTLDIQRYEIEQQVKLQNTWKQMDEMEIELREKARTKLAEQMNQNNKLQDIMEENNKENNERKEV